jgi:hypothetical protein
MKNLRIEINFHQPQNPERADYKWWCPPVGGYIHSGVDVASRIESSEMRQVEEEKKEMETQEEDGFFLAIALLLAGIFIICALCYGLFSIIEVFGIRNSMFLALIITVFISAAFSLSTNRPN